MGGAPIPPSRITAPLNNSYPTSRTIRTSLLIIALGLVSACVSVPFDYPKNHTVAPPPSASTTLGSRAIQWQQEYGELSGFYGLAEGMDALGARLRMMEGAEATIDAQYFLIKPDRAGALFTGKMLLAADRGVRVRLLLDDIFTSAPDRAIALLNSHPNIEVRLFNPMSRQSYKYWNYLLDFKRANRRMHNKSFTVDNALTIVGGRNIAEEYFELNKKVKFDDFEVIASGPVVSEVSAGFDQYWNSDLTVPMEAFGVSVKDADLDQWRQFMEEARREQQTGLYSRAVNSPILTQIVEREIQPMLASATLVTDPPEKLQASVGDKELATLAMEIGNRFRQAEQEVLIISPYFIPGKEGVKLLSALLDRGVQVIVVTNSLASTNHVPVHSGYARYRKQLLQAGARIYEIKADAVSASSGSLETPESLTLHSKATIIDRKTVFVGSLNFDPRSLLLNSEMGLFIESDEIGDGLFQRVAESLREVTYEVSLNEEGKLQWRHGTTAQSPTLYKEPLTSTMRRFMSGFYGLLPIESQL
jgi:cardiolipin synthase C